MRNSNTYQRNEHILELYHEWRQVNFDLPDTWFVRNHLVHQHKIYLSMATFKRIKKPPKSPEGGLLETLFKEALNKI